MSETIVITSGKDGVGKTVMASNMASILAGWGYKTLLIDMNIGNRNLDMRLGIEDCVVYDIVDIISGVCRIKKAIIQDKRIENLFFIMPPQHEGKTNINREAFKALCKQLKRVFDYIIIDAPAGNCQDFQLAVSPANKALLVMLSEYGAIRDAELMKIKLKKAGINNMAILVNKEYKDLISEGIAPSKSEISELLSLPILGSISYDKEIHRWANKGLPIAVSKGPDQEKTPLIHELEEITHKLISKVDYLTADTDI